LMDAPKGTTYSSVVSRESIRLFFLIAALNELDVLACDIQNAYINAPMKEKAWFVAGPELGSDCGKKVIIVRALYGMAGSSQAWRSTLASTLREFGFTSCKADPDVWFRAAEKADGTPIYEYVLCYVDDICMAGLDPGEFMKKLGGVYVIQDGSIESPKAIWVQTFERFPLMEVQDMPGGCFRRLTCDELWLMWKQTLQIKAKRYSSRQRRHCRLDIDQSWIRRLVSEMRVFLTMLG